MAGVCLTYLIVGIAAWEILRVAGETWWPGTLLALGPRWVLATPIALLAPLSLVGGRHARVLLLLASIVIVGPVMDLRIPWRRWMPTSNTGTALRVMTCNTHMSTVRPAAMLRLIAEAQPDVVAFQEWSGWPAGSVPGGTAVAGWYGTTDFEVRIESRYPIRRVGNVLPPRGWAEGVATQYELTMPGGPVPVIVTHLASPHGVIRSVLTQRGNDDAGDAVRDNATTRQDQARSVGDAARAAGPAVICMGDMNLPSDAPAFRHGFAGLTDAFSTGGLGFGWTYRVKLTTTRIDHVVTGAGWRCRRCWVGPDVGSPHRPVLADLEWVPMR